MTIVGKQYQSLQIPRFPDLYIVNIPRKPKIEFLIIEQKDVVPQERRRTVNPQRGKMEFLANEKIKVNPNRGKQGGIPEKEYPGIANPKSDQNRRQTKLVPRCPRGNSNEYPSGSNSEVPAKAKRNPRREPPLSFTPKYNPGGHQKEINS